MALIGRRKFNHRLRVGRWSKDREGLRTAAPRFQVELLETRALLSSGPFPSPAQIVPSDLTAGNPAIEFQRSVTSSSGHGLAEIASLGQAGPSYLEPLSIAGSPGDWSASLFLVSPAAVGLPAENRGFEASSLEGIEHAGASPLASTLDAAIAPSNWVEVGLPGLSGAGFSGDRSAQSGGPGLGLGGGTIGISFNFPSPYGGEFPGLASAYGNHEFFEGSMPTGRSYLAIPVEVAFESYGFLVHALGEPGMGGVTDFMPGAFTESTIAAPGEFAPFMGVLASSAQTSGFASRGAPSSGHAGVQLASSTSQPTTETGPVVGSSSLTGNFPNFVSVQRLEAQDPAVSISEPAQGSLGARMRRTFLECPRRNGVELRLDGSGRQFRDGRKCGVGFGTI